MTIGMRGYHHKESIKMSKRKYKIPFDANGSQLHYAENWEHNVLWKDNYEFEDTLVFVSMQRGQSAAYFNLVSKTTDKCYTMFMKDIIEVIRNCRIDKGEIVGKWTFTKRGQNYGIALVKGE